MPRQAKGPDGVIHNFPDDATDAEISEALEAAQPKKADPNQTPAVLNIGMRSPGGYETQDFAPPNALEAMRGMAHPTSARDILSLLMPKPAAMAAGEVVSHAPEGMVAAGKVLSDVGTKGTAVNVPAAFLDLMMRANPREALAMLVAPYLAKGAGGLLTKAGMALGAEGEAAPVAAKIAQQMVKPAVAAEKSALNYLTGNAMVDATPAERMLLAKQRLALKEMASLKQLGR